MFFQSIRRGVPTYYTESRELKIKAQTTTNTSGIPEDVHTLGGE
jgi:hypothetical protein